MPARDRLQLAALLLLTVVLRLPHLNAPLADALQAKQVYSANKARQIATPPFDPLRLTLEILDESGRPLALVEEVPVYITMLAALYRVFGESEIWGRLLSISGSLVAVAAFVALARREHGPRAALIGGLLLTTAPLFIFYGRAVMPDSWMLAAMLVTAWAYRRYWDEGRPARWLAATILAALAAVGFKYWGLMTLVVLADMARRANGGRWRAWLQPSFLLMNAAIILPIGLWMALVFFRQRNPVADGWTPGLRISPPYLILQDPSPLLDRRWYAAAVRFLARDAGPVTGFLMAIAALAAWRRRPTPAFAPGGLAAWTLMGALFFILLAPKLIDHDYYALMLLPAASLWAARGVLILAPHRDANAPDGDQGNNQRPPLSLRGRPFGWMPGVPVSGVLGLAILWHGPWISGSRFHVESGKVALGRALAAASRPGSRVVAVGPGIALITAIHYSGRAGWAERLERLPDDWPRRVARWRLLGAECLGVYFDAKANATHRAALAPLINAFPIVARQTTSGGEFVVVRLEDAAIARLPDTPPRR